MYVQLFIDAVTYPCFSNLQLKQTVSCIEGVLVYRKKQIVVDEKEVDKFAARCLEVKRMIARQQSKDELARSRSNFEEGIITKPASPSNSTRRLNPLKSPK